MRPTDYQETVDALKSVAQRPKESTRDERQVDTQRNKD